MLEPTEDLIAQVTRSAHSCAASWSWAAWPLPFSVTAVLISGIVAIVRSSFRWRLGVTPGAPSFCSPHVVHLVVYVPPPARPPRVAHGGPALRVRAPPFVPGRPRGRQA